MGARRIVDEVQEAARRVERALSLLIEAQSLPEPYRSNHIQLARLDLRAAQGCHARASAYF